MANTIKLGSLQLENPFFLAPLTKVTDLPFRLLVKKYKPGLTYTEMIDAKNLAGGKKSVINKIKTKPEEHPVGLQLFGSQEEYFKKSIKMFEDQFALFDFNLGCPTSQAVSQGAGVALLKRPQKVVKIIEAMVKATTKPVTVKIRTGVTNTRNFFKTIDQIESAGAAAICIHGRLANDSYKVPAQWELIKQAKEKLSIPVIGNGDIFNSKIANNVINNKYCDAVMIGRAAIHNPKIFEDCLLNTISSPTDEERWDWINIFYTNAKENDFFRLIRFRKRISDFLHPILSVDQRKYLRNDSIKLSLEEINSFLSKAFNKQTNYIE